MTYKEITTIFVLILFVAVVGYFTQTSSSNENVLDPLDATPQSVTLSGTYTCLPFLNPADGLTSKICKFGLLTDDGEYYAVNFGASANAMEQFKSEAHITAEGFVVIKEALSSDEWAKFNMKGIFTITNMISSGAPVQGKIDINAVCDGALAYMTFPDGAAADKFVSECKEGKHPEVIEQFKASLNLGDGANI